ncbi:hypothetical protein [Micromonospora sp. NPDC049301]|uniref:hypothetical protein n=1 Tax=Micromonospora sp. NPDC049301 TaxID=3155723 RepID=UPI003442A108
MAFRTWGRLLLTALGVSVLAGAGQLGVAYGFGIIRLTGAFTGTTVNQWPAQLVWVGWFAANAAVAGAVLTGRLARRDVPASTGRQLAIGAAAAFGATVVAPLCMQPARAAELISVDPVWAVGICAVLGAVIGAGAATAVLIRPELGWNMAAVAGAVWVLALVSVLPSLGTNGPLPTVRLGVLEPNWLDDDAAQRLALVLLPLTALLAGAATAGLARWRGQVPLVSGATGVAGPVLVAFAYLTAGPGDAVDRYQTTPYYGALIAILAGALGAAAAALLRWPARARTAESQAIEPTTILRPLPAGPALPGAESTNPANDRHTAEPTGAELAGAKRPGAGQDLRAADSTGAVRTVPAHWDWPATSASGQHGPMPTDPTGAAATPVPRAADRPRHHTDDPSDRATREPSTGGPAEDGPAGVEHQETGPTETTGPVPGTRTSPADAAGSAEPAGTATVTGPRGSVRSSRTGVDAAVPAGGPGDDGSTSTPTAATGAIRQTDDGAPSKGPAHHGTTTVSTGTDTTKAGTSSAGTTAGTTSAGESSAGTSNAGTAGKNTGMASDGTADAPAPKPRRTRKPKSVPAATASELADGTTPPAPDAAPDASADPGGSATSGRAKRTTRPAKTTDSAGSGTATDEPRPDRDAPSTEPGRGARTPAATPAPTTDAAAGPAATNPAASPTVIDPTASPATAGPTASAATTGPAGSPAAAGPTASAATGPAASAATTPAPAEPATGSAATVAPRTDRTDRTAAPGGPAGPLFGVAAAGEPEADRWTPAAPAWPVTSAWTAPAQTGAPEPATSDTSTGSAAPTEWTPRPRHRAPLPDLTNASTWDAFTSARREGPADPRESPTGGTGPALTNSAATSDPTLPTGSSSPTGPTSGPRSASDRAAARWRRAAGTPDRTTEAVPSAPAEQAIPTSASPVVPEQTGVGTGAATGGPASADAVPAASAAGDDAEQPSRRGRLGGLFRRNRSRAEDESPAASDATEALPAQDEEFVDWVAGLSNPVADNEPEQESGRRSLRSTGRHHRD